MRISDWSSDVCSSDLELRHRRERHQPIRGQRGIAAADTVVAVGHRREAPDGDATDPQHRRGDVAAVALRPAAAQQRWHHQVIADRSEEHTSELQSLMRISYAVFCLKKKTT